MAYTQNPGQGSLFQNQKTNANQPDFKGSIIIPEGAKPGDKIFLSGWNKQSQSGQYYMSLSATLPQAPAQTAPVAQYPQTAPAPQNPYQSAPVPQYPQTAPQYGAPVTPAPHYPMQRPAPAPAHQPNPYTDPAFFQTNVPGDLPESF